MDRERWLAVLVVGVVLTAPFELEHVLDRYPGPDDSHHRVSVFLFDLFALGVLGIVAAGARRESLRATGVLGIGVVLLAAATVVSVAAHPSLRGVQAVIRLAEIVGLAVALPMVLRQRPRPVILAAALVVVVESLLGVGQLLHGQVGGLGIPGEHGGLTDIGGLIAAKGTFTHRYLYVGFAMIAATGLIAVSVARERRWAVPVLFLAGLPIGLAMGRVALLGLLLCVPVMLGAVRAPAYRVPLLSWVGGAVVAVLVTRQGWQHRVTQETGSLDAFSNGRVELARQALRLFQADPLLGVGAGRYVLVQEQVSGAAPETYPVHNVPLLILAETGVVGFLGVLIVLAALALRAARGSAASKLCFLAYLPFLFVDVPYALPMGACLLGAWVGIVLHLTPPAATGPPGLVAGPTPGRTTP